MRNYQLRKTNNEHSLKKFFFVNGKGWGGVAVRLSLYVYVYMPLFSCFVVTLLIFQNSKNNSLQKYNKIKKIKNKKNR